MLSDEDAGNRIPRQVEIKTIEDPLDLLAAANRRARSILSPSGSLPIQ